MKKLLYIINALFILGTLTLISVPCAAENTAVDLSETGDLSSLVTSDYKDAFMTIDTEGDSVKVSGVFKNDRPTSIYFPLVDDSENSLRVETDGRFSGSITAKPFENGYYYFCVKFESRLIYSYTLKYNDGWSVPDNGIAEVNDKKLENITEAPPIAAAYYLSVEADKGEIEDTLAELESIVDKVCGNETDDYIKAMKLIMWIGENIYYDHDAAETSVTMDTVAIHNVLDRRRTTCAGFANTYSALLEIARIRSVNLKGAAVAGDIEYPDLPTGTENHEFSAFWYEKEQRWVYCDSCWTSNNHYRNGEYKSEINNRTKYFDVTSRCFALNHRIDKVEERFYTQALAALDEKETASADETELSVHETEESETAAPADLTDTEESSAVTAVSSAKSEEKGSLTPYIIIGLIGITVIAAGIILAVQKNKKI